VALGNIVNRLVKIIFDKLKEGMSYPINHKDIKELFKLVPEHWTKGIKLVHCLGQEPYKSGFSRPIRKEILSNKLNLSILGLKRVDVIREILTELIQGSGDEANLRSKSFRELDKNQIRRINEIMTPYFNDFMKITKENIA